MSYSKYLSASFILIFFVILTGCDQPTKPTVEEKSISPIEDVPYASKTGNNYTSSDSLRIDYYNDDCPTDTKIIIPCNPDGGETGPTRYELKLNTPSFSFSTQDDPGNSPALYLLQNKIHGFFGGIMLETEYALRDVDLSGTPLVPYFEPHFPPLPAFNLNRKGKFKTTINNGKLYVELNLFDARADVRLASDHWTTSDADITGTVNEINLSDRFDISDGQFENFQVDLIGLDVDVSRGFPIGVLETYHDVKDFFRGLFGLEPTNYLDNKVKNAVQQEIRTFYSKNVNPNAFILQKI